MSPQILELLAVFRVRSTDAALKGRMCYTHEAFALAATELELAIRQSPTPDNSALSCIPPECIALVHEAVHFDQGDEGSWERLGRAAMAIQSGPS